LEGAVAGGGLVDDDLGGDALLEQADVGDDADGLVALPQAPERVQGDVEGLWIEGAESFVEDVVPKGGWRLTSWT
jgi:hypothetical protein